MLVFFRPQPSKLSDNLVQQFLLPDQTPPILEAEMSLRAEQVMGRGGSAQSDGRSPSQMHIVSPEPGGKKASVTPEPATLQQQQDATSERKSKKTLQVEKKKEEERIEEVKKKEEEEEKLEQRQEPEGRQADTAVTEVRTSHHVTLYFLY